MMIGGVEIVAVFNKFSAKSTHGGVLLTAVAEGDNYDSLQSKLTGGEGLGLSVIATGGRDHALCFGMSAAQPVHIDDAAAYFEGPDWSMVLVFDPHFASGALVEQRPRILRRGRHEPIDEGCGSFNLRKNRQRRKCDGGHERD